jgi:uncharacterized protein YbjT (DUF2867 family)
MKIVVTTPTGNIGRVVADSLIRAGEKPILIARDPSKVKDLADAGARVFAGSHGDPAALAEATRGADALFVLTPPDYRATDIRDHYRGFAAAAAHAIRANKIPRVVHLSSVGAELSSGNGPVAGLYVAEAILAAVADNLIQLRPGYFMENTLGQIPSLLGAGALFTTFAGGAKIPMIATRDIGASAARWLRDDGWTGRRVVELQGAGDVSYDQVAAALSETLGRKLAHVTVTAEQQTEALVGMGLSPVLAASFAELAAAVESGRMRFHEPRSAANTTPTTYPEFAAQVFAPAFAAASAG